MTPPKKKAEPTEPEWTEGRWWRVLDPDGKVYAETSDEDEAREAVRPGDQLQRIYVRDEQEWRNVPDDD